MAKIALGILLVLVVALPGAAQDNKGMTVTDPDSGITLVKPKDEKWKCYPEGQMWFGKNAKLCINHVIDSLSIEVIGQIPESGKTFGEPDKVGKEVVQSYTDDLKPRAGETTANYKDIKWKKKDKGKFPGNGTQGFEIEAIITRTNDTKVELHEWVFYKGQVLVRVVVVGSEGQFKEKARDVQVILGSIVYGKPQRK